MSSMAAAQTSPAATQQYFQSLALANNMKRRKHHEIIHLWAEGYEVEILKEVNNKKEWVKIDNPTFHENEHYRIASTIPKLSPNLMGNNFSSLSYTVGDTFETTNGTLVKITNSGSATILKGGHGITPLPGGNPGESYNFSLENGEAICHKNQIDSATYAAFRGLDLKKSYSDNM